MSLDPYLPFFVVQIEGEQLAQDITQEITSFVFEDNEHELDTLTLTLTNRNQQFTDHHLFQEGNEIVVRWGYVGNLGPKKKAVIKEIDYDFPESGDPRIQIKAFDKGFKLAGKVNQKVWKMPPPGILYSDIAHAIAKANGLRPFVTPTKVKHLRVVQSNQGDAAFLKELAAKARAKEGDGVSGFVFFVQDDELHFHPRELEKRPQLALEYFTDHQGNLRSFRLQSRSQSAKGKGTEVKAIGIDPRRKKAVIHKANNASTPQRTSLGKRTYLVDGQTGEGHFREQESGHIAPAIERSEAFHEEPLQEPHQDSAESIFKETELNQIAATANTIGIPHLKAKQNIEILGVGEKFSGVYYVISVRHTLSESGYSCSLKLRKNALGRGAGEKAVETRGQKNDAGAPEDPIEAAPQIVTVDAETGEISGS